MCVCVCLGNLRVEQLGPLNLRQNWTNSRRERTTTQWRVLSTNMTQKHSSKALAFSNFNIRKTDGRMVESGKTHSYIEKGVGRQTLRKRRRVSVLDRGSHVNRRGMVDLHIHTDVHMYKHTHKQRTGLTETMLK